MICGGRRQLWIEFEIKLDFARLEFVSKKIAHLCDHRVEVDRVGLTCRLREQGPDAANHLRGRVGISNNLLCDPPGVIEVRRIVVEPTLECTGVGHHCLKWLIELMRYRYRQFGQARCTQG